MYYWLEFKVFRQKLLSYLVKITQFDYFYPVSGRGINSFMHFPSVLMQSENQAGSSRIRTWVTDSISNEDNP